MKRGALIGTIAAAVLVLGGAGVGAAIAATQAPDAAPTPIVTTAETPASSEPASPPAPTDTTGPLVAEEPSEGRDEAAFLAFVRLRQATYPTQIPNATDEDLIATGDIACARLSDGLAEGKTDAQIVDGLSVIEGEAKSDAGYFSDSGVIIASAQMNLCPETIG
ncbi:hypothetical protein [Microbacterium allomyrinae]|uniref:DUF732 domain-containing protein n=1 Tax=Microbacterium allomyrinae TaxID=2830666 RepID=A0A9X1LR77_9MICO|nr:hypothetical protein [Microbacterium allomyrinae]MCC2030607.1 hypothetical protein [Microbacterium allomyrinae]